MRNAADIIIDAVAGRDDGVRRFIIAVDGRCAAGKTTLAALLAARLGCSVFHMDDFFLRPFQRTKKRLSEPGGNVDRERFFAQILSPLRLGDDKVILHPYDCKTGEYSAESVIAPARISVVEGSYSCHPDLWECYDLRVFLDVSPREQMRRITERGGPDAARVFAEKWIPLEEKYFRAFDVAARCDLCFDAEEDGR